MTPALLNRLVALGFKPGSENPDAWAVTQLEKAKERIAALEGRVGGGPVDLQDLDDAVDDIFARGVQRLRRIYGAESD